MKNEDNLGKVPRVFLNTDIQTEECHLVVYKALSATVCLFIEGKCKKHSKVPSLKNRNDLHINIFLFYFLNMLAESVQLNYDYFKKLDNFLGPQMSQLAYDISEQYSRRPNT